MKNIEFRAKTLNGNWAFGWLIGKSFICRKNGSEVEVRPETVCQFCFLNDKFNDKIYTGDILKETLLDGTFRFYKVWVEKGGFVTNQFQDDFYRPIKDIQFWQGLSDMQNSSFISSNTEKIGNIFDNQNLLINNE